MALDNNDLNQIRAIFDEWGPRLEDRIRAAVAYDMRVLINAEIEPRFQRIEDRLDTFFKMESDDVGAAYIDIDKLKKRVRKVEKRVSLLER